METAYLSSQVKGTVYRGREALVEGLSAGGYMVSLLRKQRGECLCAATFFQTVWILGLDPGKGGSSHLN